MTKREALEKMRDHWLWIAKNTNSAANPYGIKIEYFEVHNLPVPMYGCYACEYDDQLRGNCDDCPVKWSAYGCAKAEFGDFCENPTAENAQAIADLAIKALEALNG